MQVAVDAVGFTIGISNTVQVGHRLALGIQDLHLVIHWYKAAPVSLNTHGAQVEALHSPAGVSKCATLW